MATVKSFVCVHVYAGVHGYGFRCACLCVHVCIPVCAGLCECMEARSCYWDIFPLLVSTLIFWDSVSQWAHLELANLARPDGRWAAGTHLWTCIFMLVHQTLFSLCCLYSSTFKALILIFESFLRQFLHSQVFPPSLWQLHCQHFLHLWGWTCVALALRASVSSFPNTCETSSFGFSE